MDDIDKKIVKQLQIDGQTSLKEFAKITGFSSMGVKKRIDKLLRNKTVKITALLNADSLKLSAAVVLLEMESANSMENLLERFKNCPRVVHIFSTIGGYNLIALVVAENQETLESISIEKCSLRSGRGIRRSEFYPIGNIHFSPFLSIREDLTHKEETITPCEVNCKPCIRYKLNKCVACPATSYYRGSL